MNGKIAKCYPRLDKYILHRRNLTCAVVRCEICGTSFSRWIVCLFEVPEEGCVCDGYRAAGEVTCLCFGFEMLITVTRCKATQVTLGRIAFL